MQFPVMGPRQWTLKKTTRFQRKLNKLPQDVTLASKFSLTFQIQYFEVSLFVVFNRQCFKQLPCKPLNSSKLCRAQDHLLSTQVGGACKK